MHVVFTGHNPLIHPYISALSQEGSVSFLNNARNRPPSLDAAVPINVMYRSFGAARVMSFFGLETSVPTYVFDMHEILNQVKPDVIVAMDFHKFLFWQCLAYVKHNPSCRLFLYSETKAWPLNIFVRLSMIVFWLYFKAHRRYVDKVLVYTREGKAFFERHIHDVPVELCPVPVDTELFRPHTRRTYMPRGVVRILMNARFVSYKAHKDLIDALARVSIPFNVSFIGRGGALQESVAAHVRRSGLQNQASFLEPVAQRELVDVYNNHDILVLPSHGEAIGMVVPEAMACGTPTITSDTVGANVYVRNGETGMVFRTGAIDDLARCIEKIANQNALDQMGQNARRAIETDFSVERCVMAFKDSMSL